MRRFFVPGEALRESHLQLPADVVQHLQVLRLEVGSEIELLDGRGLVCRARLESLERRRAGVRILERREQSETALPVHLLQGLPKGDKLELVLQKGVELGATRFTPVIAGRSVARGGATASRLQRWQKVIQEAARQSGRAVLPHLDPPCPLSEGVALATAPLRLLLWEDGAVPLDSVLPAQAPSAVAVLVGPEGGFALEEVAQARAAGFRPVRLGPRILRTETAGLAVVTLMQYLYGDLTLKTSPGGEV